MHSAIPAATTACDVRLRRHFVSDSCNVMLWQGGVWCQICAADPMSWHRDMLSLLFTGVTHLVMLTCAVELCTAFR
jgi:hypothetical protein